MGILSSEIVRKSRLKKKLKAEYLKSLLVEERPLPKEFVDLEICQYMGWDYWTLQRQPSEFVELILIQMAAKAEKAKHDKKVSERKAKSF